MTEELDKQAEIDLILLDKCIRKIQDLRSNKRRLHITCPIHWSSLSRMRAWGRLRTPLHRISNEIGRDLIFCVHGMEPGLPNIRIAQEFPKLANHGIFACLDHRDKAVERFKNTHTTSAGLIVPHEISDERVIMAKAREFEFAAEASGLPAFSFGVSSRSVALALFGMGYRYLEGKAIKLGLSEPQYGFHHELIHLFQNDSMT